MSIRTPVHPSFPDAAGVADLLAEVRERAPLVQCVTNAVVTGFTANVLLALGASPAMADLPGEAGVFARLASATLVNLGTPGAEQRDGAREAVAAAVDSGTPWVLDPVAVGGLPVRTAFAFDLLESRPTIIRGNASEILALARAGAGGRGVDATDSAEAALDAAVTLAAATGGAVAVSGPVDLVVDAARVVRVTGGDPLLTKVTGGGCALGAVMAAFAGVGAGPLDAAVAASAVYGLAAEHAAARSAGPGSFAVTLLDALHVLTPGQVRAGVRLSAEPLGARAEAGLAR